MDPQQQPNLQKPAQRWPLSSRKTLILIIGVVVLIGAIITAIVIASQPSQKDRDNPASVYYDRPGYDRSKLSSSISDPAAVVMNPNKIATLYQNQPIIQACNLLTLGDIRNQDILLKPNSIPTPISRTINDGVGKAAYSQSSSSSLFSALSLGSDINNCSYILDGESSLHISINVFQPFTVAPSMIEQEIQSNYTAASAVEGVEVFTKKVLASDEGRGSEYILRKGATSFYLSLDLPNDKTAKAQTLIATAAKNLANEVAQPTGVSMVTYDSPPFPKSYVRACDLLTRDDIKSLTGQDAAPLAREGIATATGVTQYTNTKDKAYYVNVRNECTRTAATSSPLGLGRAGVDVAIATTSYLTDIPAKYELQLQRITNPNNRAHMEVSEPIGNEAVAYTSVTGDGHVIFRKGRIVADIAVKKNSFQALGIRSLADVAETLAPTAQAMAGRIKD